MMHDVDRSLLLIFECSGFADVAIGDIYLGSDIAVEEEGTGTVGEAVLEDSNIAAQLAYLKGIAHWQSPMAIAANSSLIDASPVPQTSWTWLQDSKLTLDIVICVYNAVEETLDCLESIQRHTTIPHTVTIIDDKSNDLTRERLRQYASGKPWVRLLENRVNRGYTRSANIGLSSSLAEWVVLLNSDTIVTPGWAEGMFEVVKARPNVALVGPLSNAASWQSVPELHDVKGGWSVNPIPEGLSVVDMAQLVANLSSKEFPEVNLLNGFCTLMRRDVVEQVGYFDEVAFPMAYGEENDLCLRIKKAGYSLALADHVYVYHVKSVSFGSARRSELSKRGTAQLRLKHPDVDMKEIQKEMAELTSLITLRKKLRHRFGSVASLEDGKAEQARGTARGSSLTH
jgi:GT2 family glycosyltransferase